MNQRLINCKPALKSNTKDKPLELFSAFLPEGQIPLYAPSTHLAIIFHLSSMMKLFVSLLLLLQASVASAKVLSLTYDSIELTEGKSIFVKFFAPWCDSCQRMAMDFKRVAIEWKVDEVGLVAEVNCDGVNSEMICDDFEITALPTILYGDIDNLKVYEGDHSYEAMSAFAKEHISKPSCSIKRLDYCSEEERQRLVELQNQTKEEAR
jgi:thiol-disulfide isomerase/thioredoxin